MFRFGFGLGLGLGFGFGLAPAHPGGAKGARAPRGSEAITVKSACFGLIFMKFQQSAPRRIPISWNPAYASG